MQFYIRLRDAIFAETGYCFNAPALSKDATGYFRKMDADGQHAVELDPIGGCDGSGERTICITLHPYPDATKSRAALLFMCEHLGKAVEGDAEARTALAAGWSVMVTDGLKLAQQDEKTQLGILNNIYGAGRVMDTLNKHGTVAFLGDPDWPAMLNESLPVRQRLAA